MLMQQTAAAQHGGREKCTSTSTQFLHESQSVAATAVPAGVLATGIGCTSYG